MDLDAYVNVTFKNVTWPRSCPLPSDFTKSVRKHFLLSSDGKVLSYPDMHVVLTAWLYDEYEMCPLSFDFQVAA